MWPLNEVHMMSFGLWCGCDWVILKVKRSRRGRSSTSTCLVSQCVYVVTLQASLDNGSFTRQIRPVKVYISVTTTNVAAGILRSDRTAFSSGTLSLTPFGFGALGAHFGFGVHFGFGTPLGGYLPALAGSGKHGGTGGTGMTGLHVVQLPGDSVQESRYFTYLRSITALCYTVFNFWHMHRLALFTTFSFLVTVSVSVVFG